MTSRPALLPFRLRFVDQFVHAGGLALIVLLAAGCAGSGSVSNDVPEVESVTAAWSDVEEFDASIHASLPRPDAPAVEHDAPESLMNSEADDGIRVVVRGYRVQVFSSGQREEALSVEEQVRRWVEGRSDAELARLGISRSIAVYSLFKAPYYRVRIGDFELRSQAEPLSAALARRYDGVLIVPDMVEVVR
ncbi:MAG: SPOR domain-containing protein [Rhodothermales bacterium]|nr:SPOR domain-containing protein [Rhodothermales bacterium]